MNPDCILIHLAVPSVKALNEETDIDRFEILLRSVLKSQQELGFLAEVLFLRILELKWRPYPKLEDKEVRREE